MKKPEVFITAFVDENRKSYRMVKTYLYRETCLGQFNKSRNTRFNTARELFTAVEKSIENAKEQGYDYKLSLVSPGVKQK